MVSMIVLRLPQRTLQPGQVTCNRASVGKVRKATMNSPVTLTVALLCQTDLIRWQPIGTQASR